jgi:hypothetical protein
MAGGGAGYDDALAGMYAARSAARNADDDFFEAVNRELNWRAPHAHPARLSWLRRRTAVSARETPS